MSAVKHCLAVVLLLLVSLPLAATTEFDGAYMPFGMEDASLLPKLTDALLQRGYSDSDIRGILGGNTLRVMREVEAAAARLSQ